MVDLDAQLRTFTAGLGMPTEGLVRIVLAGVASGFVGLERELRGREAGLRTNILISIGACLAMIVSVSFAQRDWPHGNTFEIGIDPARLAYGVMTGMGLLCAGAIIKEGPTVRGLTTAAGLWCATAIGLAAGLGLYLLTIGAAIIVVMVLWLLQYAEQRLPRTKSVRITLRRTWNPGCIAQTVTALQTDGLRIDEVDFTRAEGADSVDIDLLIGFNARSRFFQLAQKIEAHPDLTLIAARNL
jgi:putative Mg2+ transporter-C (MgtC) family protein